MADMRVVVTLGSADSRTPGYSVVAEPNRIYSIALQSPWLVAQGQTFPVVLTVSNPVADRLPPGSLLADARQITMDGADPMVEVGRSWIMSYMTSERALYAIVADIVKHGEDNPSHGVGCSCMDHFSYEIKRHLTRGLGPGGRDAVASVQGRHQIAHILGMVARWL